MALCAGIAGCSGGSGGVVTNGLAPDTSRVAVMSNLAGAPTGGVASKPERSQAAVGSASSAALTRRVAEGEAGYRIGPHDVIEISVFKVPELSRSVEVAGNGTIAYPLIGEMNVAGRTPREIERAFVDRLSAKYLQSPQVSLTVKDYNSQRVTVEGAVRKPGVFPVKGDVSLLQIIATAEGIDAQTASNEIVLVRRIDGRRSVSKFDLDAIRSGAVEDPPIRGGDVVMINTSEGKAAFNNFVKVLPMAGVFTPLL
jgi:polysaccharide export outer membrane protein